MENLKPCPFCGGEVKILNMCIGDSNDSYFYIECQNCPCCMDDTRIKSKEDLIKIWNNRYNEK